MKLKDKIKKINKEEKIAPPKTRRQYLEELRMSEDFKKFFLKEVHKELASLNNIKTAQKEALNKNIKLEDILLYRTSKIELLEKIFGYFI